MKGENWTFRTLPPELSKTALWRSVDVDSLAPDCRARFLRYHAAIEAYLATGNSKSICREFGLSRKEIVRQLNRCVKIAPDGALWGWAALLRGFHIEKFNRTAALPVGRQQHPGQFTGAFSALLRSYPAIQKKIDALILKSRGTQHEAQISLKTLHSAFVAFCDEEGISGRQYPLNSNSRGRRSLERYAATIQARHPEKFCVARLGTTARKHMNVGRGIVSSRLGFVPFDLVGLDPHKLHCIGTVRIPGPKGPQRVAIERLWIVPILEDHSKAILGYSVGIRTECNAATIEQAIISAMSVWRPRLLRVKGMSYRPGAGFPSGLIPELAGRAWAALMVDNAAVHYSQAVAERARQRLGCAVNYGPVGHWEHRSSLERLMKTLETYGFQRLPSTTGSSPRDPVRRDPVKAAVEIGIDWEDLLDLVDVVLADYNVTPNEDLGNRTPLSVLRDCVGLGERDFLPRRLPPPNATTPELGIKIETKFIRGDPHEGRRPYVEIDRVHYTSPVLSNAWGLIGRKIRVHIQESNMCSVLAFHTSGEELGWLSAQGAWGRTAHTREMRKQVNALRDVGQISFGYNDDPIVVLMRFYASEAHREAEKKPRKISRAATKLAQASAVSGHPIPEVTNSSARFVHDQPKASAADAPTVGMALSKLVKPPKWKTIAH